jgi:hypothetical protein
MEGTGTGVAMAYLRGFILVIFREVIRTIGIFSRTFLRGFFFLRLRLRLRLCIFLALLVVQYCLRCFG